MLRGCWWHLHIILPDHTWKSVSLQTLWENVPMQNQCQCTSEARANPLMPWDAKTSSRESDHQPGAIHVRLLAADIRDRTKRVAFLDKGRNFLMVTARRHCLQGKQSKARGNHHQHDCNRERWERRKGRNKVGKRWEEINVRLFYSNVCPCLMSPGWQNKTELFSVSSLCSERSMSLCANCSFRRQMTAHGLATCLGSFDILLCLVGSFGRVPGMPLHQLDKPQALHLSMVDIPSPLFLIHYDPFLYFAKKTA